MRQKSSGLNSAKIWASFCFLSFEEKKKISIFAIICELLWNLSELSLYVRRHREHHDKLQILSLGRGREWLLKLHLPLHVCMKAQSSCFFHRIEFQDRREERDLLLACVHGPAVGAAVVSDWERKEGRVLWVKHPCFLEPIYMYVRVENWIMRETNAAAADIYQYKSLMLFPLLTACDYYIFLYCCTVLILGLET